MVNKDVLVNKLAGIVGWEQPYNPAYAILDAANLTTRSGYLINSNPFVKVETLKDTQDYVDINDADFNTFLYNIQKSAITAVVNEVFTLEPYIDRQVLYPYANNKIDTVTNPTGFVGLNIEIDNKKNIAFEISRIFLEFEGTGDVELLLFNSSKKAPIYTQTVSITDTMQEVVLNWVVDNTSGIYKGEFKLGYINNSLDVTPIKREYEASNITSNITHLYIEEIFIKDVITNVLWDLEDEKSIQAYTGLNPDITVYDDYTDLVIQNERLFAYAISLDAQIKCLGHYLASNRSNKNQRLSESKIMQAIEGQSQEGGAVKIKGLRPTLYHELQNIKTEIEKLRRGYEGAGLMVDTLC